MRPKSWYRGSQLTNTSSGTIRAPLPIARILASRLACESTTPFGLPVLPEVYWMNAMSPGAAFAGVNARRSPGFPLKEITRRSPGTMASSKRATGIASATVMSATACALARMPAWRRTWSSIRDICAGG